jgi:acyl-CoA thioester hydrolase
MALWRPARASTMLPRMSTPASPGFATEIAVAADDIDELGHVSNVVYVRWILHAAQAHSRAVGYDFAAYQRLGAVFVVRRHEVDYLASALAGDRILLRTWVDSLKAASSVRMTSILRLHADREVELARGRTLWALIDLETGRPRRIPDELRAAFGPPRS